VHFLVLIVKSILTKTNSQFIQKYLSLRVTHFLPFSKCRLLLKWLAIYELRPSQPPPGLCIGLYNTLTRKQIRVFRFIARAMSMKVTVIWSASTECRINITLIELNFPWNKNITHVVYHFIMRIVLVSRDSCLTNHVAWYES